MKKLPVFNNEDEEREFWAKNDINDYIDESKIILNPMFPNLKPSSETISLRLPKMLLENIKSIANKKGLPYHLIKSWLDNDVSQEMKPQALHNQQ